MQKKSGITKSGLDATPLFLLDNLLRAAYNVSSEIKNTKRSTVLQVRLVFFFLERTLIHSCHTYSIKIYEKTLQDFRNNLNPLWH